MSLFLCNLWPYLAGGLIGWLLAGWMARRFRHSEPAKLVDNPEHLSLISKLQSENKKIPSLVSQVANFKSAQSATVDNAQHLSLISNLEKENKKIPDLMAKLSLFESAKPKVVEKIIEKRIDNPDHLKRIAELEKENSEMIELRSKLNQFESAKPVDNPDHLSLISQLEKENNQIAGLQSKLSLLEKAEPKIVEKEVEKQVDNPQHLIRIKQLEGELEGWKRTPNIDIPAAKAVGITVKADGDFTAIEGVGPKINELLHEKGIKSYKQLSETDPADIKKILEHGGASFKMANPDTWSDQANLATNNRWAALKSLQDVLDGGIYPDASASSATKGSKQDKSTISDLEKELDTYRKGQAIDASAAKASGIIVKSDGDFTAIEGIGPKINDLLHAGGIQSFKQLSEMNPTEIKKILDDGGASFKMANPGTWPDQANLVTNNRWSALKALQDILDGGVYPDASTTSKGSNNKSDESITENKQHLITINNLEKKLASYQKGPDVDTNLAKSVGFNVKRSSGKDDFTVIEGIGPKINDLIHDAGIDTFTELANTSTAVVQTILNEAGPRYKLANPETWSAQSNLAASNQWGALKAWQDVLDGGEE